MYHNLVMISAGDLIKFDYVYENCDLNHRIALYLGKSYIYRKDGVTVKNHKVQIIGDKNPMIIDNGLLPYMKIYKKAG